MPLRGQHCILLKVQFHKSLPCHGCAELSFPHKQDSGEAAKLYLDCSLWSVCIFIRISSPVGNKQLKLNYHYKPASYLLKAGKSAPTGHEANLADYDIVYGAEQRGNDQSSGGLKIVTLSSVGAAR